MIDDHENCGVGGTAGSTPASSSPANQTSIHNVNSSTRHTIQRYRKKETVRESHAVSASGDIESTKSSADAARRHDANSSNGCASHDNDHNSGYNNGNHNENSSESTPSQIFFRSWPDPRLGTVRTTSAAIQTARNRLPPHGSPSQVFVDVEQHQTEPEIRNITYDDNQPEPTDSIEQPKSTVAIPLAVAVPFAVVNDGIPISDGYPLVEAVVEIDGDQRPRTPNSDFDEDDVLVTDLGPSPRHTARNGSVEANENDVCGEEDEPSYRVAVRNCLKITVVCMSVTALVLVFMFYGL